MWGLAAARGVMIALLVVVLVPVASASGQETFYLGPDGFPNGSLVSSPSGGEMPNFDLGRDIYPGLSLERSALGLAETDGTRFQQWQGDMTKRRLTGYPSVVIWSAPAGFDTVKTGVLSIYLLDCDAHGGACVEIGSSQATVQASFGETWVESRLDFDAIDHSFADRRHLGVRVVVDDISETDMMLGYGYPKHRSRLTIFPEPLPPQVDAVVAPVAPAGLDQDLASEKLERLNVMASAHETELDAAGMPWPWLASLTFSTLALAVLGGMLISNLTKLGRHEERFVVGRSGRARRFSLSTN
ncbi:MAG TPA: hypothetical protein VMS99_07880 [Acidimicrobiia bacterium]|nr:hypothetical protein [Acidimicrobiia bacterium]